MLPQRVITSIMGFLSVVVAYSMRTCLSVAITEMVEPVTTPKIGNESMVCDVLYLPENHSHGINSGASTVSRCLFVIHGQFFVHA